MRRQVFIVGCGYVGMAVALHERQRGVHVRALARSSAATGRLQAMGIETVAGDLDQPDSLQTLRLAGTCVYYFAPPPSIGSSDPRMDAFLEALRPHKGPSRLVLVSTTGVYGDCGGQWIDEQRPPNPQTDRARRRLTAERALQAWGERMNVAITILRVAGIYGPDRLPIERLRKGLPVLCERESPWSNRVHVDDLVSACLAAAGCDRPGRLYNISDGHPTTMTDYFNQIADTVGLPRPPQVSLAQAKNALSSEMLSYLSESR
ncbi:MAG: SDR family oxidoreductase, partial [Acidiferrobacterales bacterium]|nr:SDR family oxidoreductase [Acidiferrobacterales bacterium]